MILIDEEESDVATPFAIPAATVGGSIGEKMISYINQTRKSRALILPATTVLRFGRALRVAAFSAKGPNSLTPEILKPDITAPGLNILAAWSPADREMKYNILSGTSMSCPHVTGLVALIKAVNPSWSASAIKSSLMTTATVLDKSGSVITADPKGRQANPFYYGSGFPDPSRFLNPGLIFDIQPADYKAFLCSIGYDNKSLSLVTGDNFTCTRLSPAASDLNYPSIAIPDLKDSYSVTRTVTNVGNPRSIYQVQISVHPGINVTVVPEVLVFEAYGQKLSFIVNFRGVASPKDYVFGSLSWKTKENYVTSPLVIRVASSRA